MLLRDAHVALGARLGDTGSGEAVLDYTTLDREVRHLDRVAVFDAGMHGVLWMRGGNALKVLHNVVTSDLAGMVPGHAQPSLLLDPKGHVVGLLRLWRHDPEHIDLLVEAPCVEAVKQVLGRYATVGKAPLEDRSREVGVFLVQGPLAQLAVREATGAQPPALGGVVETPAGNVLAHHGLASAPGFVLVVRQEQARDAWERLLEAAKQHGGGPVGWHAVESARVRAGVPRFGAEATPERLPGECGLEPAISFTKGCFVGQETVARIKHLGHVNRLCVRLQPSQPCEAGEALRAGEKEVGVVTSVAGGPGPPAALAVVRREHAVEGALLQLPSGDAKVLGPVALAA